MTNGENNMIDIEQMRNETTERVIKIIQDTFDSFFGIKKPTLTEDERVILRNIKGQPKYISRQKGYGLMAFDNAKREGKTGWSYDNGRELSSFSHLFQFIKERRRIRYKRINRR